MRCCMQSCPGQSLGDEGVVPETRREAPDSTFPSVSVTAKRTLGFGIGWAAVPDSPRDREPEPSPGLTLDVASLFFELQLLPAGPCYRTRRNAGWRRQR
jgi:hypothetical protein